MKADVSIIKSGYDKKKCLVHARSACTPDRIVATAQYLNIEGCDLFDGILSSVSTDNGKTWSTFEVQKGLAPDIDGDIITVGCDATPMYHRKTGKVLLLGHTAQYKKGEMHPTGNERKTFYSIYDARNNQFSRMKFIGMPKGFECFGNGCGQSIELEDGDLLIPVYGKLNGESNMYSTVLRCTFDGNDVKLLNIGNLLTIPVERGAYEPSIVLHKGAYYMTLRNDECGLVAKSQDGMNYTHLHLWRWDDGSVLQNYNTQQHWMPIGENLYLVYTRRADKNDHVFRHRAPLFAARVEDMKLVRDSEFVIVPERGARLGNFGVTSLDDKKSVVMAAEWMQPRGCEKYGSNNAIFFAVVEE